MVLSRAVRDGHGRTLLPAGSSVRAGAVETLNHMGIANVFVEDPRFEGLEPAGEVPDAIWRMSAELFAELEQAAAGGGELQVNPNAVRAMVAALEEAQSVNEPLTPEPPPEEGCYLPMQAVNAARLALAAAPYLHQGQHARDLAMAAIVKDVGMLRLPLQQRMQAEPWGQPRIQAMQGHVAASVAALKHPYWPPFVKAAVDQHHERWDGSGYPRGLAGDAIHPLGQLLGAIDCYCALISPRPHRPAYRPEEALEMLLGMANWLLPAPATRALAATVGLYPQGSLVRLSTGQEAIVLWPGRGTAARPKVRLVEGRQPLDLGQPEHLTVQIQSVIDD
jgi:hypothetical protein